MTLYRQYRPQTFADLVGHDAIKLTIQQGLREGKPAHSYLFVGPRGVGKTTLARLIAKSLNCQQWQADPAEPCNTCSSCQAIIAGHHLDVLEIDAASNRGIDEIRQLKEMISLEPTSGKKKVYIIDEVHMLTKEAWNALLKTIEEPPPHVVFIMATTEAQKVPATIISRCQRFDLRPATLAEIVVSLKHILDHEQLSVDADALEFIALQAQGGHRDAASLLEQIITHASGQTITKELARTALGLPDDEQLLALIETLATGNTEAALTAMRTFEHSGTAVPELARQWLRLWQALLYLHHLPATSWPTLGLTEREQNTLLPLKDSWSDTELVALIENLMTAANDAKRSPLPLVPLELVALRAVRGRTNPQPTPPSPAVVSHPPASPKNVAPVETQPPPSSDPVPQPSPPSPPADTPPAPPLPALPANSQLATDLLAIIHPKNITLAALLRDADLAVPEPGKLQVNVKFAFHKKKLAEPANRQMIEAALKQLTSQDYTVEIIHQAGHDVSALKATPLTTPAELDNAVRDVFGLKSDS